MSTFQLFMIKIKRYKLYTIKNVITFLILFVSYTSHAEVVLNELTQLNTTNTSFRWEQAISHPTENNHFYVFNFQGVFTKVINGKLVTSPIIDLSKVFLTADIKLTSIALHPNFHLEDLPGYQTFYTAHQQHATLDGNKLRLPEKPPENSDYDLIINEWRLSSDNLTADLTTRREIIRIASPEHRNVIKKIAFNPYLKPWQDGFNSLYIVLNHVESYKHIPLYSGVLLRINPEKFGLRNYTIPEKNPFKRTGDVTNEIIAYGLNNITGLLWNKTKHNQWLYTENFANETLLKEVSLGQTLEVRNENVLWKSDHSNNASITWYEGSLLSKLTYHLITLELISDEWQLSSIDLNKNSDVNKTLLTSIPSDASQEKLQLFTAHNNELLIFNTTKKTISEVKTVEQISSQNSETKNKPRFKAKQKHYFLWAVSVLPLLLILFIIIKKVRNFDQEKALVRKLYAKFNFIHHNEAIELYKRHKAQPQETLQVGQIQSVNVILNNEVINTIDNENNAFTEQAKKRMLQTISLEHRLKMVDNRKRIIIVEFVINKKTKHQLSLYVRRGNQRYTRTGYQESLIMLVHLCNTISEKINQHE